jgi:2'-5' RNA ligase superfamily
MRNLITVAFVEPVAEGLEFPRDDWPLHITLVKFDVVKFDVVDTGTEAEPGTPLAPGDLLAEHIAALMADPVAAALGSSVLVGGEARFGRAGSIPVNLIEPSEQLQFLHNELVRIVEQLPGRISTPSYTLEGYRPHVSHHGDKRLRQGDTFALDRIALVDMAPDGRHATRRILKLWTEALA